ncbi:MAG: hypothetical protein VKL39_21310 [Leptolyngbyaceae bacterium]|nr:hypothetical protein [Leptolyngbyaceae bacterium]
MGREIIFQFTIAKLLDYAADWSTLEANTNPFSTVVMAHLKAQETRGDALTRKNWKVRLTRRLYEQGYRREDILELYRFIDWLIELPAPLEAQFQQEIAELEEDPMRYLSTIERQGIEQGIEQGRETEARYMLTHRQSQRSSCGSSFGKLVTYLNRSSSRSINCLSPA